MGKFKKGDKVKVTAPIEGLGAYGIRKGSVGIVQGSSFLYYGSEAYQVWFPKAGNLLTIEAKVLRRYKNKG